ncbi:MAG: GNAT family N-acetyltransferase [Kofleriaceae bacterium]
MGADDVDAFDGGFSGGIRGAREHADDNEDRARTHRNGSLLRASAAAVVAKRPAMLVGGCPSGYAVGTRMQATVRLVETARDLEGILALQRASRAPTSDGFVTVEHTLAILQAMHALAPSVIAVDARGDVVGYALVMPRETRTLVPILEPMFALIDELGLAYRWYVMGQVAVAPAHRGSGLFDAMYAEHRARYRDRFDAVITEIATRNTRSVRAHARVGFETLVTHRDATDEWALVAWAF